MKQEFQILDLILSHYKSEGAGFQAIRLCLVNRQQWRKRHDVSSFKC